MNIPKALITIAACILVFAAGGLGIGALIGVISPDYYRTMFERASDINSVQFGMAIGLANGATYGFFAGVITVLASTWYRVRVESHTLAKGAAGQQKRRRRARSSEDGSD